MTSEGEGPETIAVWRSEHEAFWHSAEHRGALRDPTLTVDDDTPVVLTRFRLVSRD